MSRDGGVSGRAEWGSPAEGGKGISWVLAQLGVCFRWNVPVALRGWIQGGKARLTR